MRAHLARWSPYAIATLFIAAGYAHFRWTGSYERTVPDYLPSHRALVLISGFFEVLGGAGAALPAWRRRAGWGLIALLIAVFPANVFMAMQAASFADVAPGWLLYVRLPFQLALIAWVYVALVRR